MRPVERWLDLRFKVLFVILTLTVTAAPVLPVRPIFAEVVRALVTVTLLAGLFTLSQQRRLFTVGIVLSVTAVVLHWIPIPNWRVWGLLIGALFLFLVANTILRTVLRQPRVTADAIYGAVSVYLLLGLIFAFGFSFLYAMDPSALAMVSEPPRGLDSVHQLSTFVYYSFVTLTTLGYGDVTPISALARSVALLEAVLGQLYLVVLIARLVGLQIAHELASVNRR